MTPDTDAVKRLPRSLLFGAKRLVRSRLTVNDAPTGGVLLPEILGLRRVNEQCVELEPYVNLVRSGHARSVGLLFVLGIVLSPITAWIMPGPISTAKWIALLLFPFAAAAFGGVMYLCIHRFLGRFRGGFIRIHRGTRKLYFVTLRDERLLTLDWDQIQALAGYIPIISAGGYTSRYPLYLIAIDWRQAPPQEMCVACGNLGWRDDGGSARQLWDYLQIFMEHGPASLNVPSSIPPRLSRKHTFLRYYSDWVATFHRDLATPRGRRWALLLVPAKILWLICMVFPDSLAEFIEYNVPYTSFPKEIDELCGFNEKRVPIMRLNGERIDS